MRCPDCGHQQRAATGWICHKCRYEYVLDHKHRPHLSDWRVVAAARSAAGDGTRWFTAHQVIAVLARRRRLSIGLLKHRRGLAIPAARKAIEDFHARKHSLRGLLMVPSFDLATAPTWPEPDLFDYGAERVLVVDDPLCVDLLVRMSVHINARAVIVSAHGYPQRIVGHARALVEERADIPVLLLHSSAADTGQLIREARDVLGFGDDSHVLDLGLPVDAAKQFKVLRWARRIPDIPLDCLPYGYLANGLVGALVAGVPLAQHVRDTRGGGGSWVASDGDYG